MLPYRFALIVSPFSNKRCKIPLGNYWGSPWEWFPASLTRSMQGTRHLPRITCSQMHGARGWLFPGVVAKKWAGEGHGNSLVTAASGSSRGLWEMKQHVWFWSEEPNCLSKVNRTSLSTQFYTDSPTQRCCEFFISVWLIISSPENLPPGKDRRVGLSLASSTLLLWKGWGIYYFLCFPMFYLSEPGPWSYAHFYQLLTFPVSVTCHHPCPLPGFGQVTHCLCGGHSGARSSLCLLL